MTILSSLCYIISGFLSAVAASTLRRSQAQGWLHLNNRNNNNYYHSTDPWNVWVAVFLVLAWGGSALTTIGLHGLFSFRSATTTTSSADDEINQNHYQPRGSETASFPWRGSGGWLGWRGT